MPKLIKIPQPVIFKNPINNVPEGTVTFREYLELALFNNPSFDNPAGWRLTAKLSASAAVAKDTWLIDNSDWERLKEADSNPAYVGVGANGEKAGVPGIRGMTPGGARQLLIFSDAIQDAVDTDEKPAPKKAKA